MEEIPYIVQEFLTKISVIELLLGGILMVLILSWLMPIQPDSLERWRHRQIKFWNRFRGR
jgi:hypothetical protein